MVRARSSARKVDWLVQWIRRADWLRHRDLKVTAIDDLGFAHYVYNISGTLKAGTEVDMWVRATVCLVKKDGQWRITHEHTSVPYHPKIGKALVNLAPEGT